MKIRPVGPSCSMRMEGQTKRQTDRQTDIMKLIVAFQNCANLPKNGNKSSCYIQFAVGREAFL